MHTRKSKMIHGRRFPQRSVRAAGPSVSQSLRWCLTCRNLTWEEGWHFGDGSTTHYWSTRDKNTTFRALKEEVWRCEKVSSLHSRLVFLCVWLSHGAVPLIMFTACLSLSLSVCLWLIFPQLSPGLRCVTFHPACRSKYSFHRKQTSASREQAYQSVCVYACMCVCI